MINYLLTYYILKLYYRRDLKTAAKPEAFSLQVLPLREAITDHKLATISGAVALLTIMGFFTLAAARALGYVTELNFGTVALLGSAILYTFSSRRREIIRGINWSIVLFFIAMFIVMQSIWNAGLVTRLASYLPPLTHTDSSLTLLTIIGASVALSQLMSNVPFVAVYINLMKSLGFGASDTEAWIALAGASTLAGNLTILGAASTIIILEAAEEKGHTFSFFEYFKVGSIVTLANIGVMTVWLLAI